MASIYEQVKALGLETDNHESDLWVKNGPGLQGIIDAASDRLEWSRFTYCGEAWVEFPFMFDPWWKARRR